MQPKRISLERATHYPRPTREMTHDVLTPVSSPVFVSRIRESMVKIMVTSDPRQQHTVRCDPDEGWQVDGIAHGGDFRKSPGGLSVDPSTCGFWCAIALGALVRGSPFDTVSKG